jgi:hypothetical protein
MWYNNISKLYDSLETLNMNFNCNKSRIAIESNIEQAVFCENLSYDMIRYGYYVPVW